MSGYTRTIVGGTACLVALAWACSFVRPRSISSRRPVLRVRPPRRLRATFTPSEALTRYCAGCHNGGLKTAGLALDTADRRVAEHAEVWEKVVRTRACGRCRPPRAGPTRPTYAALTAWLEAALDRAAAALPTRAARPPPAEPRRVHQRHPRPPRRRDRRATLLPADDSGLRLRQHRRRAVGVARAARAVHARRRQDQPRSRSAIRRSADRGDLSRCRRSPSRTIA